MAKWFLTRVLRTSNGKRTVFSTNCVEKTGYPLQKNEVGPLPNTIYKKLTQNESKT